MTSIKCIQHPWGFYSSWHPQLLHYCHLQLLLPFKVLQSSYTDKVNSYDWSNCRESVDVTGETRPPVFVVFVSGIPFVVTRPNSSLGRAGIRNPDPRYLATANYYCNWTVHCHRPWCHHSFWGLICRNVLFSKCHLEFWFALKHVQIHCNRFI